MDNLKRPRRFHGFWPLLLWAAACSHSTGPGSDQRTAFDQARQRWEARGIADYRVTLNRICECLTGGPAVVVVAGGAVVGVSNLESGLLLPPPLAGSFPSIDELFDRIGTALDEGAAVEAEYDPERGHPVSVLIDPVPDAVDDEVLWQVSDLEPGAGAAERAELMAGRQRWAILGFDHYDLDLRRTCDCETALTATVKVRVRSGQAVSRSYSLKGEPVAPEHVDAFPTIEGLFGEIARALDRGADVELTIEPEFGFPREATIVYRPGGTPDDVAFDVVKLLPTGPADP